MYKPTQIEIDKMMEAHSVWLSGKVAKQADFSNMDLAGIDLSGCDLAFAPFSGASLSGANLKRAILSGCPCTGANFVGAYLENAYISDMKLFACTFDPAELCKAHFLERVAVAENRAHTLRVYTYAPDLADEEVYRLLRLKFRYGAITININPDQFLGLVESGLFSP